jgi:hypothetical protein
MIAHDTINSVYVPRLCILRPQSHDTGTTWAPVNHVAEEHQTAHMAGLVRLLSYVIEKDV